MKHAFPCALGPADGLVAQSDPDESARVVLLDCCPILVLCVSGTAQLAIGDTTVRLSPGEVWLRDTAFPSEMDARVAVIRLERGVLAGAGDFADGFALDAAAAQPVSALLHRRWSAAADPSSDATGFGSELAVCLAAALEPAGGPGGRGGRLSTIRAAIDRRLADRTLDGKAIARAAHMSRSTVYRLLEPFGGVERVVMRRRLDRLRQLLKEPACEASLPELAERVGFATASHVSRAFLQRFGLRPGRFRSLIRSRDPAPYATMCRQLWGAA